MIDSHIQFIYPEIFEYDVVNQESFIKKSFQDKKSIDHLKKYNGKYIIDKLSKNITYENWIFYCYCFSCDNIFLNNLQNKLLLENSKKAKIKIRPVAAINPNNYLNEDLNFILRNFYGVHFKPDWISDFCLEKNTTKYLFKFIEKNQIPLFLHMGYIYSLETSNIDYVKLLADILASFPKIRLVLEHCGGGIFLAETYKKYQNLFKTVCYSISSPRSIGLIDLLFSVVPHERICFGSDYPFCDSLEPIEYLNNVKDFVSDKEINFSKIGSTLLNWSKI